MSREYSYKEYVASKEFYESYSAYQQQHASSPRESDKVLLGLVKIIAGETGRDNLKVLDVGCSTGNLLMHLRNAMPGLELRQGSKELIRTPRGGSVPR